MSDENQSKADQLRIHFRKLRDENLIDFTDKKDYASKLKQICKDFKVEYPTAFKHMKEIAQESGKIADTKIESTTKSSGNINMKFESKATSTVSDVEKTKEKIETKRHQIESEITSTNLVIQSDAYKFLAEQNYQTLLMIREMVKAFNIPVADEKKFEMISNQMALKEIQEGWQLPKILSDVFFWGGLIGIFVFPAIPKIKEYLWDGDSKKSDEPLDEIPDPDQRNGKGKENDAKPKQ